MTETERDRIARVEAKVDRILSILDDPDFGIRPKMKDQEKRVRTLELKFYGVVAGLLGAILLQIQGGITLHG